MKIYVAGKDLNRAKNVIDLLRIKGHEITYDWVTKIDDRSNMVKKSADERSAVQEADALVYLWESDQESARYEAGMAMGLNKPVIVCGCETAFFFQLPEVIVVKTDEEISQALLKL